MDSRSRLIQRHSLELRRTMSPRSWLCYRCAHSQIQNIPPFHNKAVVSGGCMPTAPGIPRRYLLPMMGWDVTWNLDQTLVTGQRVPDTRPIVG